MKFRRSGTLSLSFFDVKSEIFIHVNYKVALPRLSVSEEGLFPKMATISSPAISHSLLPMR